MDTKRILSFVLISVFVLSMFSCAAQDDGKAPEFGGISLADNDFDGAQFVILSDWSTDDPFDMGIDTLYGDMMVDRVKEVKDKYNCDISYASGGSASYVMSAYASGLNPGDLYYGSATFNLAYGNCLFPLTEVSDIVDYTNENKYGTPNLLEYSMAGGIPYGVVPVMWPSKITSANMGPIMVIGEDLIMKYGLDDPRDFYEQGVWDLNKLEEITPIFHIKDGEKDVKALSGSLANFSCGIFGAVSMLMVSEVSDGVLTAGYNTPEMIAVLDWARDYCAKYADDIVINGRSYAFEEVAAGNAVLAVMASYIVPISEGLDNFGIVPFPHDSRFVSKGDQRSYYDFFNSLAILLMTDEPEHSATILSALCEPFEGYYSDWNGLVDFLNRTLFFDERDGHAFIDVVRQAVCDYNPVGGYSAFSESGLGNAFLNMSATEAVEKFSNSQDSIISDYVYDNYYGYMKDYWDGTRAN